MRKNRIAYVATLVALLVLLFLFSEPYFGCAVGILLLLALASYVQLRRDSSGIALEMHVRSGGRVGKYVPCELKLHRQIKTLALRGIIFELEAHNALFQTDRQETFYVELSEKQDTIHIPYEASRCGEVTFRCLQVKAVDFMGLFTVPVKRFTEKRMMIHPYTVQTDIDLAKMKTGSTIHDGVMQNRKGTDPSEMFDVREYVPGDDIRAIHWKLSGKFDNIMLREASEPVHYQVALLPDMGKKNGEHEVPFEEINACIAVGEAVCQTLLQRGISFGVILPSKDGLYLREVNSRKDINRMMSEWLSMPLPEESGIGLRYFLHEHMQQYFTSLLILSAGTYAALPAGLDERMDVTVVNTVDGVEWEIIQRSGNCEIYDLPAKQTKETYILNC